MTDQQVERFLGQPAIITLRVGTIFTGSLVANRDGTYGVAPLLGRSETQQYVQRFRADEMASIAPI